MHDPSLVGQGSAPSGRITRPESFADQSLGGPERAGNHGVIGPQWLQAGKIIVKQYRAPGTQVLQGDWNLLIYFPLAMIAVKENEVERLLAAREISQRVGSDEGNERLTAYFPH